MVQQQPFIEKTSFLKPHGPISASFNLFPRSFLTSLSLSVLHRIEGWTLLWIRLGLKECCGWFDLLSGPLKGFPGGASGKEPTCQCRRSKRRRLKPWVGKIPWRRAWQPTPVFLPGESQGQRTLAGYESIESQRVGHD